jgi:colanic acid/amylovoran biosynthesis glycosyltransferase
VETHKWPVLRSRISQRLKELKPDIVHAQFGPEGVIVGPVADALNIPLAVTFHGYDVSRLPKQEKVRGRYKDLFEEASVLIGVSDHNSSMLKELGAPPEKVRTIHNGTRLDQFSYSDPLDRFDGETVRLLHVGRLVEKKGPLELVDSFRLARENVKGKVDLQLTVAGDGPLREKLLQRVQNLNLDDSIDYAGSVSHGRVQDLMREAHLYTQHCKTALDGDVEGQGVTFIEAQASGLPVIATRSGGVPSVVVDGDTGYLVPEEDTEAMADRITELALHPERWEELSRKGRKHVEDQFDLTKQVKKLVDTYDDMAK